MKIEVKKAGQQKQEKQIQTMDTKEVNCKKGLSALSLLVENSCL